MMTVDGTAWTDEEKRTRPNLTRLQRWRNRPLLWILLFLGAVTLLLALVSVVVVYYHYSPPATKKLTSKNPCDMMVCSYGSLCFVDDMTQQAYCRCRQDCPNVFVPVCGNDGATYSSECLLRLSSCTHQRQISVEKQGPCDTRDPCRTKECRFGSVCHVSADGNSAECVCPEECDVDDTNHGSRPVCGSDGRNYQSGCHLRKISCLEMRPIEMKYKGVCDPCDGVECQTFQVCQLDDGRNPICRCNSICSPDFKPVCGSDGKTYTNECTLRVEGCKSRKDIRIIYTGECSTGSNPCDNLQCGPNQNCIIDRRGTATCQCLDHCEPVMRPVCGSDGESYDNECELLRQSCQQKRTVYVEYQGQCGDRGPCFSFHCSYSAVCIVKSGLPTCECPTCTEEYEPVCGTDGISYTNNCKLRREACEQKSEIAVAYSGLCSGCENKKCEYYAVCQSDGNGNGKCVCPQTCIKVDAKVCGSDEVTYANECEMRVAACKKAQYVLVFSKGPCDLCRNVRCKYGARCDEGRCICPTKCPKFQEPVCANDGITYKNECEMRQAACKSGQELNILFFGECDEVGGSEQDVGSGYEADCDSKTCKYGGECGYDDDGLPVCICNLQCPALLDPVCASDGHLYDNSCRIKEESCRIQKSLMPVHIEMCEEFREIPCDGEIPLVDSTTGKDYFCGDGLGSKLCPPGSYCHKSSAFAKCCSEVILIKTCAESIFGCCTDGKTTAQGPNYAGCPSMCNCNRLGSRGISCDPDSKQCSCKTGVGGPRCDRCEPGYWGLHKITEEKSEGCSPCACNLHGSVRVDCEQMTGRCVCKNGVQGMKCDECPRGTVLGPDGCMDASIAQPILGSCDELMCFHGAICRQTLNKAQCVCDFECPPDDSRHRLVCGSDGNTYGSECQMKLFSCRYQKVITVVANMPCNNGLKPTTFSSSGVSGKSNGVSFAAPQKSYSKRSRRHKNKYHTHREAITDPGEHKDDASTINIFCGVHRLKLTNQHGDNGFRLDFTVTLYSENGLVSYGDVFLKNESCFFKLLLQKRFLQFRYHVNTGMKVLHLRTPLSLGVPHHVFIHRNETHGILQLDKKWRSLWKVPTKHSRTRIHSRSHLVPSALRKYKRYYGPHAWVSGCIQMELPQTVFYELPDSTASKKQSYMYWSVQNSGKEAVCSNSQKCPKFYRSTKKSHHCLPTCSDADYELDHLEPSSKNDSLGVRCFRSACIEFSFRTSSKNGTLFKWQKHDVFRSKIEMKLELINGVLAVVVTWRNRYMTVNFSEIDVCDNKWHDMSAVWKTGFLMAELDRLRKRGTSTDGIHHMVESRKVIYAGDSIGHEGHHLIFSDSQYISDQLCLKYLKLQANGKETLLHPCSLS